MRLHPALTFQDFGDTGGRQAEVIGKSLLGELLPRDLTAQLFNNVIMIRHGFTLRKS